MASFRPQPLASDALAFRIIFPLVRVIPLSFKWMDLPASLGKKKTLRQAQRFYNFISKSVLKPNGS
tara:strand:- start:5051 stop:5248 length:198 start_codon:yes stop_codon:yes gene_type:complete